MSNYSEESDLLIGDIPLPRGLRPQKYVDDATNEIDSFIGFIYQTPVDVTEASLVARPARLLLKRIANQLASGRLIMAQSTGSQRMELHAYGARLVNEATAVLRQIANGEILLPGALPVDGVDEGNFTGPQIANLDPESNVEAFYNRIANPTYFYGYPGESVRRVSGDGGLVA